MLLCATCSRPTDSFINSLTHGAQPQSSAEYTVVAVAAVFLVFVIAYSIVIVRKGRSHEYIAPHETELES
jgi:hypothetical protein